MSSAASIPAESARLRLTLRPDLTVSARTDEEVPYFLIEDPLNSKFYRLGHAEYAFLSRLDGRATVGEISDAVVRQLPGNPFSLEDALALAHWLLQCELACLAGQPAHGRPAALPRPANRSGNWGRWNLITLRLPPVHPDKLFEAITPCLSWMYGGVAALAWVAVVLLAGCLIAGNWDRFTAATNGIFAPGNWTWLTACWLLLKIVHEVSHGVVCKRYGGTVREAGVLLILLFPAAYVDVTSSWRFPSRWQRIHTALAGVYAELFLAAVAAVIWTRVPDGPLAQLCASVVVMASVTTLLFNANPLMRYDGYYVLSDFLQVPNLYPRGQQRVGLWVRRYLLGVDARGENDSPRVRLVTSVYGLLSCGWRILVCLGLVISASALFAGAGVVIAAGAVVAWLLAPAVRFTTYLVRGTPTERPRLWRFAWSSTLLAALVVVPLGTVPWIGARTAPAIVEHAPLTVVRAASRGFVRQVQVTDGHYVPAGRILVVLDNPQLQLELADLELAIEQLDLKRRSLATTHQTAELQAHDEHRTALEKKRTEKLAQVEQLIVRAPVAGRVVARQLASATGSYLEEGATILTLANERNKELKISVAQPDADPFSAAIGCPVRVRLPGVPRLHGTLAELAPRADLEPVHPALSAVLGGPLAVHAADDRAGRNGDNASGYQLFEPRFNGTVTLTAAQSATVRAGQRGVVSLSDYRETLGGYLYRTAVHWLRNRLRHAFGTRH